MPAALSSWENEGGAPRSERVEVRFGCRMEPDGSWTVYDRLSGGAADTDGRPSSGLDKSEASRLASLLNANAQEREAIPDAAPSR